MILPRTLSATWRRVAPLLLASLMALLWGTALPLPANAEDPVELSSGHADIGVVREGNGWVVRIKDDSSEEPIWRDPDSTSLRVSDAAKHSLPEGDDHNFLGAPGDELYLIPQTQADGVLWLGWNTQHESVLQDPPKNIEVEMTKVQGPGSFHVYLDYGGFRAAKQLWGDNTPGARIGVPVNTHAHANWAFSKPGTYRVKYTASITEKDGSTHEAVGNLQFLVGNAASAQSATDEDSPQSRFPGWAVGVVCCLVLAAAALAVVVARRRRRVAADQ